MDLTLEDNMVDGLFFCATLTGRRGGHVPFVQAGAETSDTGFFSLSTYNSSTPLVSASSSLYVLMRFSLISVTSAETPATAMLECIV